MALPRLIAFESKSKNGRTSMPRGLALRTITRDTRSYRPSGVLRRKRCDELNKEVTR